MNALTTVGTLGFPAVIRQSRTTLASIPIRLPCAASAPTCVNGSDLPGDPRWSEMLRIGSHRCVGAAWRRSATRRSPAQSTPLDWDTDDGHQVPS